METLKYPTETKAKKLHRCNFCGEKISIGEIYYKSTHACDGELYDWKAHWYCCELATKLKMYEDAEDGVTDDMFQETIHNKHDDILIEMFQKDEVKNYSDVIQQLRHVSFRYKLFYVVRKLEIKRQP